MPAPALSATLERGRTVVRLDPRARVLEAFDAATKRRIDLAPVGVGPTHVVSDGRNLAYVADTAGDAVLVVRLRPRLQITRRVHVPGAPYGLAIDVARNRLWVTATATNELVELSAGGRPRELARSPAPRQPDAVAVDEASGRVFVTGRGSRTRRRLDGPGPRR